MPTPLCTCLLVLLIVVCYFKHTSGGNSGCLHPHLVTQACTMYTSEGTRACSQFSQPFLDSWRSHSAQTSWVAGHRAKPSILHVPCIQSCGCWHLPAPPAWTCSTALLRKAEKWSWEYAQAVICRHGCTEGEVRPLGSQISHSLLTRFPSWCHGWSAVEQHCLKGSFWWVPFPGSHSKLCHCINTCESSHSVFFLCSSSSSLFKSFPECHCSNV